MTVAIQRDARGFDFWMAVAALGFFMTEAGGHFVGLRKRRIGSRSGKFIM